MTMSTLLEIKSSVLRQVQSRQSFRRRAETDSGSSTPESSKVTGAIRENKGDGDFFERMRSVLQKQESMRRSGRAEGLLNNCAPPPPETVGENKAAEMLKLTRRELEMLYEEAAYSIVHRCGVASSEHTASQEELLRYLQEAFELSDSDHESILQRVKEAKAPVYALKVTVMQAKNLLAKDPNGFSDPYCMLGIMILQNAKETEERKERKFSFRKKKEKVEKRSSIKEVLPAKYIQVTEVKSNTLNPLWKENFHFEIDDIYNDQFHLDIWDHDDDVSVAEACKKLNEVSGFKGMGRYFKQIVKSARANGTAGGAAEDNMDDFLGCLNIAVNEIPVGGLDKWFKLEPRSSSSRVQGDCHLILKLVTTQIDYYSWKGELSKPAVTVLSHHGVQTDLSALQLSVVRWRACSKHHQTQGMDYSYLLELLRRIEDQWDPDMCQREQEQSLAESFNLFTEYCLSLLKRLRDIFPVHNATAVSRLEFMLRCLSEIHTMKTFKMVCPFHNELHLEIAAVLKKGTLEWYETIYSQQKPREKNELDRLRCLVRLADDVHEDIQRSHNVYNKLFVSIVKVDLFSITYRQLEKLVADEVSMAMEDLRTGSEQEGSRMTHSMGETLFELYITLNELKHFMEFLPLKDNKSLALAGFHEWFQTSIHMWLQTVYQKTCERIQMAVEMDKLEYVDSLSKHSCSAVDVTTCFSQIREFWVQLAWPDSAEAFVFMTQLTDNICNSAIQYSEAIKRKVDRGHQSLEQTVMTEQLCIILNNIEHVRKFLANLLKDLDWKSLEMSVEQSCGPESKQQMQKALNTQLLNIDLDMQREAKNVISHLTEKMIGDIKKYIQHISLSPDSIQNDDAVSPLMKYLDDKLIILSESLVKENLYRVLEALWWLLLKFIIDAMDANRGVPVEFYGRFYYTLEALVEFFHAEGQGLPLESLRNGDYKILEEELRLHKCSTSELIEQYYLDKLKEQRSAEQNKYGRISIKCYYEASEQRLYVEVLHAADLIALDANGLSDPFVIIELCPHHIFPLAKGQRTQVKAKTLHPVYDELFHFSVTSEQCRRKSACILFTVMDHDWLSTNDFAGEAILPMNAICGLNKPQVSGGVKNVQPTVLKLTRPKANVKSILKMLDGRMDKEAQDFVKKLKEMEKYMGEEE
ncbi:BAI1-associated protein 3 isoform X2 [Rhinatrema bivittatum]|uniref:BAI1-associated protein 3 isoform X2 n=1 Tax=Rhinatrema bivittatum TaxID=194408 RepID=UPI0011267EA1|nr:BAI1-associated protein 3 isoform X2 [Rhinatrema bivittatum]